MVILNRLQIHSANTEEITTFFHGEWLRSQSQLVDAYFIDKLSMKLTFEWYLVYSWGLSVAPLKNGSLDGSNVASIYYRCSIHVPTYDI